MEPQRISTVNPLGTAAEILYSFSKKIGGTILNNTLFEVRDFDYFQFGNTYTGSLEQFRYRIVPKDETLIVSLWHGEQCFDRAEIQKTREFPLSPEG